MKTTIKQLLREYLEQNMVALKDYFNMSDEQKATSLLYDFTYTHYFDDFLIEEDIEYTKPKSDTVDVDGNPISDMDNYEFIEWLQRNDPELWLRFGKWLLKKVENHAFDIPDADYPTWSFFATPPALIKNQWLIHFTNNADDIAAQGFTKGVDDMTKLGLTTHLGEFDKKYGGYNFAYTLSDFDRYGRGGRAWSSYNYGDEAVIFRASGLKLWHYGDEEPQVLFYGKTATNIIPITSGENAKYAIRNAKTGRIIYENDAMQKIVDWVVKNFIQYRKKI